MGGVWSLDTAEVRVVEQLCGSSFEFKFVPQDKPLVGLLQTADDTIGKTSVLPLEKTEAWLGKVWISSMVMMAAQLEMVLLLFEMLGSSVKTAWLAAHQIIWSPLERDCVISVETTTLEIDE